MIIVIVVGIRTIDLTTEIQVQVTTEIRVTIEIQVIIVTQAGAIDCSASEKNVFRAYDFFYKSVYILDRERQISIIWCLPLAFFVSIDINISNYLVNINQDFW